jgi:predicted O-methyltransferase YrrM
MTSLWKSCIKHIIPKWIIENDSSVKLRLSNLETAVQVMLESPVYSPDTAVGFNGQCHRKAIFKELLSRYSFELIVETGTWIGNTTGYMAEVSGLPVYSAELDPRFAAIARMRLRQFERVTIEQCDSRTFLKKLAETELRHAFPFFYLDAHWNNDLPLNDEIRLISATWEKFVIMIDDFGVPGDPGYGFDDYGEGKALVPAYIEDALSNFSLTARYPALRAEQETGGQRGCVVLTRDGNLAETLSSIQLLR